MASFSFFMPTILLSGFMFPVSSKRWTPSAGQLIDVAKWNLLRYIPVNMGEAEDDEEETTQSFPSL